MVVKQNHRHVSPDGLVYLPYLHEWSATASSLVGLAEIASSVFSIEPPLFSRPAANPLPVAQQQQQQQQASPLINPAALQRNSLSPANGVYNSFNNAGNTANANANANGSNSTAGMYNTYPPPTALGAATMVGGGSTTAAYNSSANTMQNQQSLHMYPNLSGNATAVGNASSITQMSPSGSSNSLKDEENKRLALVDQVSMKMYEAIDKNQRKLRDEIDAALGTSSVLQDSSEAATALLAESIAAVSKYADALKELEEKTAAFDVWDGEESTKPTVTALDRLVPSDSTSEQIAHLVAEVNAIDDAFYYLERALVSSKNETVDLNTFLRECRQLARKQFLCKAHLKKISAHCLQKGHQYPQLTHENLHPSASATAASSSGNNGAPSYMQQPYQQTQQQSAQQQFLSPYVPMHSY
jgi:hypothetical protein